MQVSRYLAGLCAVLTVPALAAEVPAGKLLTGVPMSFEANRGQAATEAKYLVRAGGLTGFFTSAGAVLTLQGPAGSAAFRLRAIGASPAVILEGLDRLPGWSNYLTGPDPAQWITKVPTFRRVAYRNVYPGIDIIFYGKSGTLEYDVVVSPGADPKRVRFELEGADSLTLGEDGSLRAATKVGDLRLLPPRTFQQTEASRQESVASRYVLGDERAFRLELGPYDSTKTLWIDPALVYSTFFGGNSEEDLRHGLAVDADGNTYVAGTTRSPNFPVTPGVLQPTVPHDNGDNAFVAKLNPAGDTLLYSTFLGTIFEPLPIASSRSTAKALAVDSAGNAYVTGEAHNGFFPQTFSVCPSNCFGPYVLKLSPDGDQVLYSAFVSSSGSGFSPDRAADVAVDGAGSAYVVGSTASRAFPVTEGAFDTTCADGGDDCSDGFVFKLNPQGNGVVYATYLGGALSDVPEAVEVDGAGSAHVVGWTLSGDYPLRNEVQSCAGSASFKAFVTRLGPAGDDLAYSTCLGDSSFAYDVALDSSGAAHVTGEVRPFAPFPRVNPSTPSAADGLFVSRLGTAGSLLFSTVIAHGAIGRGIAVDAAGAIYVAGSATSGFPDKHAVQRSMLPPNCISCLPDGFLLKLVPQQSEHFTLDFSTVFGGSQSDAATAVAVVAPNVVQIGGVTNSPDLIRTPDALDPSCGTSACSASDVFLARIDELADSADIAALASLNGSEAQVAPGRNASFLMRALNRGPDASEVILTASLSGIPAAFVSAAPNQGTCSPYDASTRSLTCSLGTIAADGSAWLNLTVRPSAEGNLTAEAKVAGAETDYFSANDTSRVAVSVLDRIDLAVHKFLETEQVPLVGQELTYRVIALNQGPSTATSVVLTDTLPVGATFVSTDMPAQCGHAARLVTCNLGTLDSGDTVFVRIKVLVQTPGILHNEADITGQGFEAGTSFDNHAEHNVQAYDSAPAELRVFKSASRQPAVVGLNLEYAIQVNNSGPFAATNVRIQDALPAGMTLTSASTPFGDCQSEGGVVTCLVPELPAFASTRASIHVVPEPETSCESNPGTCQDPVNRATVSADQLDTDPTDNSSEVQVSVRAAQADLDVFLYVPPFGDPKVGVEYTYTVDVGNRGPDPATGITFALDLPPNTTLVAASPNPGDCAQNGEVVTCTVGALPENQNRQVALTVIHHQLGSFEAAVTVTGNEIDPHPFNTTQRSVDVVAPLAGLALVVTDQYDPMTVGNLQTLLVLPRNEGPDPALNARLTLSTSLPVEFASASTPIGSCAVQTSQVVCDLGTLVPHTSFDESARISILLRPSVAGTLTSTATLVSDALSQQDPQQPSSAVATHDTQVRTLAASTYVLTPLGPIAGVYSRALGINELGQVVGESSTSSGLHAFLYDPQEGMRDLGTMRGTPGSTSVAYGINNLGQVVGQTSIAGGDRHAFRWDPGTGFTDLGTLGGRESIAYAINDAGQIVGDSANSSFGLNRSFLFEPATGMRDLLDLGAEVGSQFTNDNDAHDINEAGQIVGEAAQRRAFRFDVNTGQTVLLAQQTRAYGIADSGRFVGISFATSPTLAFLSDGTSTQLLGSLNPMFLFPDQSRTSQGFAVNNRDEVVGVSQVPSFTGWQHAFLWRGGNLMNLNSLLPPHSAFDFLQWAYDINDDGAIVGTGVLPGGFSRAFVMSPAADVGMTAADAPDPAARGAVLRYSFQVTNHGSFDATGVRLSVQLPGPVTFVSASPSQGTCNGTTTVTCDLGDLANAAQATLTVDVVPTTAGTVSVSAHVSADRPDHDLANNDAAESTEVIVVNEPPVANAGPDRVAECSGAVTPVLLDGTGSSDPDRDPLSFAWAGPFGTMSGAVVTAAFPFGASTAVLTVSDGQEGDTDDAQIQVVDTTPPALTVPAPPVAFADDTAAIAQWLASVSARDACGAATVTHNAPPLFPVGQTTVTFTATDTHGHAVQATAVVRILLAQIVFASSRDGGLHIFKMSRDGSAQTRLTSGGAFDSEPAWSPDGTKIVFTSTRTGNGDIYRMNADGTGLTRLTTSSAVDMSPAWSPDGTKIAFASLRDGNFEIYRMNADGTTQMRLTSNGAIDAEPAWSPDGTKIAFTSTRTGNGDIYRMNADGTGVTRLTTDAAVDLSPAWSPDGARIAFMSSRTGLGDIYRMNGDGTAQTRLTTSAAIESEPTWSPDGASIVFTSTSTGNGDIYRAKADGTALTRLTTSSGIDLSPN